MGMLGGAGEPKPEESEIFLTASEDDDEAVGDSSLPESIYETPGVVHEAGVGAQRSSDFGAIEGGSTCAADSAAFSVEPSAPFRPFEDLPPMPDDLKEAFELFKLAVIAHKLAGWKEIAMKDVLAILEGLRQLVRAPAE